MTNTILDKYTTRNGIRVIYGKIVTGPSRKTVKRGERERLNTERLEAIRGKG